MTIHPEEWSVHKGFEEFIANGMEDINAVRDEVFASLGIAAIRNSIQHPNGFLVNTLENEVDGQLRLHTWPTGKRTDVTPHSHPWHMVSLVLAGNYIEYIPDLRLDDQSSHQLMISTFSENRKQVGSTPSGRGVSFDLGEPMDYVAGEYHTLPAGAFHATPLPQAKPIVTLVRTSQQFYENPSYVESELNRQLQMTNAADRRPLSEDQVQAVWREVATLINAQ